MGYISDRNMSTKQEVSLYVKITAYVWYVLAPVFLGNIMYWSHGVMSGKSPSWKVRVAIFAGSLAMASGVHHICTHWNMKEEEWILVWFCSIFAEHMLKFLYLEFWGIVKGWMIIIGEQALKRLKK